MRRFPHHIALQEAVVEAEKIVNDEIDHFLQRRDRKLYIAVLKSAANSARWREIKSAAETARGITVNDSSIRNTIESLKASMPITEKDKVYQVTDLMLKALLRSAKIN